MLADDLLRQVALDSLPPDVPAGHNPLGVQHIQRVVGDAFDQQPKTALALEQILLLLKPGHRYPNEEKRLYGKTVPKKHEAPEEGAAPETSLIFSGFASVRLEPSGRERSAI